ncbi:hypothetical protein FRC11_012127, partial [Ceratobasidium sp. 423]
MSSKFPTRIIYIEYWRTKCVLPPPPNVFALAEEKSPENSDLDIRIEFPQLQKVDLLDVLVICYSVEQSSRASGYIYQKDDYDGVFFCLTVLAILARRLVKWAETVFKPAWPTLVHNMLDRLRVTQCKDAYEDAGLGICDSLDPEDPSPRDFILGPLRRNLRTRALNSWLYAASRTLWFTELEQETERAIEQYVSDAIDTTLTGDGTCAAMRSLLDPRDGTGTGIIPEFTRLIGYKIHNIFLTYLHSNAKITKLHVPRVDRIIDFLGSNQQECSLGKCFYAHLQVNSQNEENMSERRTAAQSHAPPDRNAFWISGPIRNMDMMAVSETQMRDAIYKSRIQTLHDTPRSP